ncbi:MAG: UMP kinase [Alphaproteobacteria bacterium]|nr:UMP kinase [Alphaproteobacteria bacterium]MBT5389934.1 UMP kinase [Alphaproteobacteria bacterium]MBT5540335.1 UMP kinase [Alphaproteobacteria bacterium]MBT5655118.1 UMP kinase [Alphaproteobacteria bacterium]
MLKISGEALMGDEAFGLEQDAVGQIVQDLLAVYKMGIEVCLVVGGGNIFRGISGVEKGIDRATGDYMGMLSTVINALALQSELEKVGVDTRVISAISMSAICEPYVQRRAIRHLEKGRIVIFAAGTGNPFFSTDTAAALRASEMKCNVLMKGTKVDGVYSADPVKIKDATRYERLSYLEVLSKDLKVMDAAAVSLARENGIPIVVFSIRKQGALVDVVNGKGDFTIVSDE